jgi:predicted Fe-Mo cluster-binding NifX family protein
MKVVVSSSGNDLDSHIDPRFGRCAYFLIVETDDMRFEAFDNENLVLGSGAGIQSAQFVVSKGAKAVITGNCGPNAMRALIAGGTEVFVGQSGTVREAVKRYINNELRPATEANVSHHFGIDGQWPARNTQAQAPDWGMGMGRGMGKCGRKGIAGGMGRNWGPSGWDESKQTGTGLLSNEEELSFLQKQAAELKRQVEGIQSRIRELEKKR